MKQAVQLFRGANPKMMAEIDVSRLEQHGLGKAYDIGDAERLFELLLIEQAIEEQYIGNASGFTTAYIQVRFFASFSSSHD